ncbi:MAG: hypothetical protein RLN60_05425 [Phycisphaerales bacterium]
MSVWRALALILCLAATASAQDAARLTVVPEIGWDSRVVSDSMCPVFVNITGGDESESGLIIVESGSGKQICARVVLPFASTPGRTARFEVTTPIPPPPQYFRIDDARFVEVTVRTADGASTTKFLAMPSSEGLQLREPPSSREAVTILNVGATSLPGSLSFFGMNFGANGARVLNPGTGDGEMPYIVFGVAPDKLATRLPSYEGIDMIVLADEALDALAPNAVDAIRAWVARGGRLVLLPARASTPLDDWDLAGEIEWRRAESGDDRFRVAPSASPGWHDESFTITFTPTGEDEPVDESIEQYERRVGYGQIVLLRDVPRKGGLPTDLHSRFWVRALEAADPPVREWSGETHYGYLANWIDQSLNYQSMDRATRLLEDTEPFPIWIFAVIVAVMGLLVGPVDLLVLKRLRKRQYSWATTLLWVSIAGALTAALPNIIRPSQAQVGRFTVLDAIQGEPLAMRTGYTTVFSASPVTASITDQDPEALWRPIPSIAGTGNAGFIGASPITIAQPVSPLPTNIRMPTWSLRTFQDEAALPSQYRARVTRTDDETFEITIDGIDPASAVEAYAVVDGKRYVASIDRETRDASRTRVLTTRAILPPLTDFDAFGGRWNPTVVIGKERLNTMIHTLTGGAHRRTALLEQQTTRGNILVGLLFDAPANDAGLDIPDAVEKQRTLLRLLVPIDSQEDPSP